MLKKILRRRASRPKNGKILDITEVLFKFLKLLSLTAFIQWGRKKSLLENKNIGYKFSRSHDDKV
jgi:hypothetical protein